MPSASSATQEARRPRLQGAAARCRARRHAAAQRRPDPAARRSRCAAARSSRASRVGGVLSNNKGINRQGGGLTAPALTAKDMDDIKTAVAIDADYLAVSFPKNKEDMYMARAAAARCRRQRAADRQDRARRGDHRAGGDHRCVRRHHGRARRSRRRSRQRRGARRCRSG